MQEELIKKLSTNSELTIKDLNELSIFDDYDILIEIFGKEHVARSKSSITEGTICFIGDLDIDEKLPTYNLKYVYGMLNYQLDKVYNLDNLIYVNNSVFFNNIKDAGGLENLEYIKGHACFNKLKISNGLENLLVIGMDASFPFLEDPSGLVNLKFIKRNAYFSSLKNLNGLENLGYVGGDLKVGGMLLAQLRGKKLCLKK